MVWDLSGSWELIRSHFTPNSCGSPVILVSPVLTRFFCAHSHSPTAQRFSHKPLEFCTRRPKDCARVNSRLKLLCGTTESATSSKRNFGGNAFQ